MVDRIIAQADVWLTKRATHPVIRLYRVKPNGNHAFLAPLDYSTARALVDQIHDLVDEYEQHAPPETPPARILTFEPPPEVGNLHHNPHEGNQP
jgi:hypothetical protein